MAYVRRLPRVEYVKCSRSISLTLDPIHTEYTGSTVFWKIDLVSEFHQIRSHDEDVQKTVISLERSLFSYPWPVVLFEPWSAGSKFILQAE